MRKIAWSRLIEDPQREAQRTEKPGQRANREENKGLGKEAEGGRENARDVLISIRERRTAPRAPSRSDLSIRSKKHRNQRVLNALHKPGKSMYSRQRG